MIITYVYAEGYSNKIVSIKLIFLLYPNWLYPNRCRSIGLLKILKHFKIRYTCIFSILSTYIFRYLPIFLCILVPYNKRITYVIKLVLFLILWVCYFRNIWKNYGKFLLINVSQLIVFHS